MKWYMFLFLTALLCRLNGDLFSQSTMIKGDFDPEVMKNSYYRNGIYASHSEFLKNSPAEDLPVSIRGNKLMYNDGVTNRLRLYIKPVWGVCINNQIYLKHAGKFVLVQPSGRFSYFLNHRQVLTQKGFPFEGSPYTRPDLKTVTKEFFIDFKTDNRYKLNKFNVENILKNEDGVLYEEFMKTEHRKYFLKEYILKLNNKYAYTGRSL